MESLWVRRGSSSPPNAASDAEVGRPIVAVLRRKTPFLRSRPGIENRNESQKYPVFTGYFLMIHGGFAGARTRDLGLKRALLYRLSYEPALRGYG